ncbi:uncharacterized protein LOC144306869 isoform X2 [Canis aureus]
MRMLQEGRMDTFVQSLLRSFQERSLSENAVVSCLYQVFSTAQRVLGQHLHRTHVHSWLDVTSSWPPHGMNGSTHISTTRLDDNINDTASTLVLWVLLKTNGLLHRCPACTSHSPGCEVISHCF